MKGVRSHFKGVHFQVHVVWLVQRLSFETRQYGIIYRTHRARPSFFRETSLSQYHGWFTNFTLRRLREGGSVPVECVTDTFIKSFTFSRYDQSQPTFRPAERSNPGDKSVSMDLPVASSCTGRWWLPLFASPTRAHTPRHPVPLNQGDSRGFPGVLCVRLWVMGSLFAVITFFVHWRIVRHASSPGGTPERG